MDKIRGCVVAQVDFAKRAPGAAEYVKQRTFESDLLNKYLSYMHDNQAPGEEAALEFLFNEEATWSTWVSERCQGAHQKIALNRDKEKRLSLWLRGFFVY